jgi:hypothetical protein
MPVFMKSTGRSGLGKRRKGTATAWKEVIRNATLPSDEYLGVRAGTPAERKRDRDRQMIIDAEIRAEQEALRRGFGGSDTTEAYVRRNDGGIARKTKVF